MAKITRKTQKIFGSAASSTQVGQIGSLAAGTPTTYSGALADPTVLQALSNYLAGWNNIAVGASSPAIEDMNGLHLLITYQLAYLLQAGVAEWDAGTTYYTGSLVNDGTGTVYRSLTDTNLNNAVTVTTSWLPVTPPLTTLGDMLYVDSTPKLARLAGNAQLLRKYLMQNGTGAVSAAPSWIQPVTSDILGSSSSGAPGTTYLGEELSAAPGTATTITTGSTTSLITKTLTAGTWFAYGSMVVSGSGTTSVLVQPSFDTKGVVGTIFGKDLLSGTLAISATMSFTFAPRIIVVLPADANKNIGLSLDNFGGASVTAYPYVGAIRL